MSDTTPDEARRLANDDRLYKNQLRSEVQDALLSLADQVERLQQEPCQLVHIRCGACGCAIREDTGLCNCDDNREHPVATLGRDLLSKALIEQARLRKCETADIPVIEELEQLVRDAVPLVEKIENVSAFGTPFTSEVEAWLARARESLGEGT